jgi:tRNA(Ile)-lysidine synthase
MKVSLEKYKHKNWLIAFSGGADSRVLLELLFQNRSLAKSIIAIYVNHHLQEIANEWEEINRQTCVKLGIEYVVEHVVVDITGSIEANARNARYKAFAKHMTKDSILFTAHHSDDLLESILLSYIRGSGLDGVCATPKERVFEDGLLVRPLLEYSRAQIEDYCVKNNLSYVVDPTNSHNEYDRNFIRNNITPLLKNRFPQILTNTYKTSQNLCADKRVLDAYYEEQLRSKLESVQWGIKVVSYSVLLNYSDDFKLGVLHYFFKSRYCIVPTKSQLLEILDYESFALDNKFKLEVGSKIVSVYRDYIYVADSIEKKIDEQVIALTISNVVTYNGYCYKMKLLTDAEADFIKVNNEQRAVNIYYLNNINEPIILCFKPKASTRVHPHFRNHSQTLKNIWKEIGIPLYLRPNYPIVMKDNMVLGMLNVFECKGIEKDKFKVVIEKEIIETESCI